MNLTVWWSVTEWEEELAEYSREHPHMRIVDSFDKIRPIMSRFTMLAPFDTNGISLMVSPTFHFQESVRGSLAKQASLTSHVCLPEPSGAQ